jgi:hypothetical protein
MAFIDILSLILSFGIIFSLRFLFPRNIVPLVSTSFEEAVALLERAESVNIPYVSEYRENLAMYACLYPGRVLLPTDPTQSAPPILTDAYGEPSLSEFFSTVLPAISLWPDLETVCRQIASRRYQAKDRGWVILCVT